MAARQWTPEQRRRQSEAIRRWKPWQQATGPRTTEGKRRSAKNALKHGCRSRVVRSLRRLERDHRGISRFTWGNRRRVDRLIHARELAVEYVRRTALSTSDPSTHLQAFRFISLCTKRSTKLMLRYDAAEVFWESFDEALQSAFGPT